MKEISYQNLSEKLTEAVPEILEKYKDELQWWGEESPGAHIVFGDVLVPFVISLLESSADEAILKRIFLFLEQLAENTDPLVQEVIAFTICERLGDNPGWLSKARQYMGERTKELCDETERYWHRTNEK